MRRTIARALLVMLAYRLLGAWLIGLPLGAALTAAGVLEFPRGEALLFEPGAHYLLETLMREQGALLALGTASAWPVFVWALFAVVPLWLLLDAVRQRPRTEQGSARARHELPSLLLLAGVTSLLRLLTISVSFGFVLNLRNMLEHVLDERAADLVALAPGVLGLVMLLGVALLQDLARTAVVEHGQHAAGASVIALLTLRRRGAALVARYSAMGLLGALCLGLGIGVMLWIDPEHSGTAGALLALALHQTLVLGSLATRAAWLWFASAESAKAQPIARL
jgi:hypothetical protein